MIPGYLLDTSVLLALGLDDHLQNSAAEQWLTRDVGRFATCPLTQLGFLRITKQLRRDISIHQIGAVLGVTKGRVSQLHRSALTSIRKRMAGAGHFRLQR